MAAGIHIARSLQKSLRNSAHVTLVDACDYYTIRWATVRAHVCPELADRIFIPYRVRCAG